MLIKTIPLSSFSTVFYDKAPKKSEKKNRFTLLQNEVLSFKTAFCIADDIETSKRLGFEIITEKPQDKSLFSVYLERNVPVLRNKYGRSDDWFLRDTPGLYPDALLKVSEKDVFCGTKGKWQTLLINFNEEGKCLVPGKYGLRLRICSRDFADCESTEKFTVEVLPCLLPKQDVTVTNWVHYDCMSHFAACKPFSARFWKIFDAYVRLAAKNGQNMILTPCFTPPLDTVVGGERETAQLVGVSCEDGKYTFDFSLLDKFIDFCTERGIERFEHSHFFTQWGAEHAPKVVVLENRKKIKKFGWQTEACGKEYTEFLSQYIPALVKHLDEKGCKDRFFFHVSDEPTSKNISTYAPAAEIVHKLLGDLESGDALGEYRFYEEGHVHTPICHSGAISEFVEKKAPVWMYFTGFQTNEYLTNRLIGMSAARNRILGTQMYYYGIKGFLQWGFNAHHNTLCRDYVNPYASPDCDTHFCGGTSYLVYPEPDGASPSLRLFYFRDAMQDIRAYTALEKLAGRDFVVSLIEKTIPGFGLKCRVEDEVLASLLEKVHAEIAARTKAKRI